jgi:hypothetical protein
MTKKSGSSKKAPEGETVQPPASDTPPADENVTPEVDDSPPAETAVAVPTTSPTGSERWRAVVGAFATTIGKSLEEVTRALTTYLGGNGDEEVDLLERADCTPDAEIVSAVGADVTLPKMRKAIAALRTSTNNDGDAPTTTPAASSVAPAPGPMTPGMITMSLLPTPHDDGALLDALRTGGVDRVGVENVEAAIRSYFANKAGWFGIPDRLAEAMEKKALALSRPADQAFYDVYAEVVSRKYAEVISALNVDRRFMSQKWQTELLRRTEGIETILREFHGQLRAWYETWTAQMGNPGMIVAALVGGMGAMPGMSQIPDFTHLYDKVDAVVDRMNAVFAGPMIPAAAALASRSVKIKEFLKDERIRVALGYADQEEMLRELGIAVPADAGRQERDMVQYILSVYHFRTVTGGQEATYLTQLFMLGERIIGGNGVSQPAAAPADAAFRPLTKGRGRHQTFGDEEDR